MRTIHTDEIIREICEMCIEANLYLSKDITNAIVQAKKTEKSPLGCQILEQLEENMDIAAKDQIPICQDTGMAVVFLDIGQELHIEGMLIEDAVMKINYFYIILSGSFDYFDSILNKTIQII